MRMRRRVPIVLMTLANILILAHAVVPHHHHNRVFMTIVDTLDDNAQNMFHHEHDFLSHYDIGDFLVLSQSSVVLSIQYVLYATVEELCEVHIISSISKSIIHWPYTARGHTDTIVHSVVLRAPPAC